MLRTPSLWEFGGPGMTKSVMTTPSDDWGPGGIFLNFHCNKTPTQSPEIEVDKLDCFS
jgi:hypothetical protein